jgi:hypothetical protein
VNCSARQSSRDGGLDPPRCRGHVADRTEPSSEVTPLQLTNTRLLTVYSFPQSGLGDLVEHRGPGPCAAAHRLRRPRSHPQQDPHHKAGLAFSCCFHVKRQSSSVQVARSRACFISSCSCRRSLSVCSIQSYEPGCRPGSRRRRRRHRNAVGSCNASTSLKNQSQPLSCTVPTSSASTCQSNASPLPGSAHLSFCAVFSCCTFACLCVCMDFTTVWTQGGLSLVLLRVLLFCIILYFLPNQCPLS